MELRPYQKIALTKGQSYINSDDTAPVLMVLPVGAGKSFLVANLLSYFDAPCLSIQPSTELFEQNTNRYIEEIGGDGVALYSASVNKKDIDRITFATIKSLKGKGKLFKEMGIKYVLIDEAHFSVSPKEGSIMQQFLKDLSPRKTIGLTASPFYLSSSRMSGATLTMITRSFPRIFEKMIHITQVSEMVDGDFWAKLDYVCYPYDSAQLILNKGGTEFTEESILISNKVQGVNNRIYVTAKKLLSEGAKAVLIFVDSVENAIKMANALPLTECIHATTNKKDRKEYIRKFKAGELRALTCVSTLTIGFDYSEVDFLLDGNATNSLSLYYQKLGRGVRRSETKTECTIHDFCGNYHRFGRIEDLVIEYYNNYGWGVFSGDRLLTGVPLQGLDIRKKDLDRIVWEKPESEMKIWFKGKFEGKFIHQVPYNIREFWLGKWDFTTDKMVKLKNELERLNKTEAMNKLTKKKVTV